MSEIIYPTEISAYLGGNRRETMQKISAVLAFVSRALEIQIDAITSTCTEGEFSGDELYGLMLICRSVSGALAYEPPPTMPLG